MKKRNLIRIMLPKFSKEERVGLSYFVKLVQQSRLMVSGMLVTNVAAAIFEGGTIGILAVGVSALTGGEIVSFSEYIGPLGNPLDQLIEELSNIELFFMIIICGALSQILKSGLQFLSKYISIELKTTIARKLQEELTEQTMSLPYAEISKYEVGYLNSIIMLGDNSATRLTISVLNNGFLALVYITVYLAILLSISVTYTLISLLLFLALYGSLGFLVRWLKRLNATLTAQYLETARVSVEFLSAPRLIRLFNAADFVKSRMNDERRRYLRTRRTSEIIENAVNPIINVTTILGASILLVLIIAIGGVESIDRLLGIGMYGFVLLRIMPQVRNLNTIRITFVETLPMVEKISPFLVQKEISKRSTGGIPSRRIQRSINFENVSFCYPGSRSNAVDDCSFEIKKGTMVALFGHSGSGKSTLADILLGLIQPDSGRVLIDGVDLRAIDNSDWLDRVGVVDQEIFLLNSSIRENILFPTPQNTLTNVMAAAQAAHAHEFIVEMENGYDTTIGERGHRLSGGQLQRLALARALIRNPEVLVLDEATSALDLESERLIQLTLSELKSTTAILIIAHRFSTIKQADQVIVMKQGKIVEVGTAAELVKKGAYLEEESGPRFTTPLR